MSRGGHRARGYAGRAAAGPGVDRDPWGHPDRAQTAPGRPPHFLDPSAAVGLSGVRGWGVAFAVSRPPPPGPALGLFCGERSVTLGRGIVWHGPDGVVRETLRQLGP